MASAPSDTTTVNQIESKFCQIESNLLSVLTLTHQPPETNSCMFLLAEGVHTHVWTVT